MTTVASRDLRNHTADVLRQVSDGTHVIVTVNGVPVAEISPVRSTVSFRPALPETTVLIAAESGQARVLAAADTATRALRLASLDALSMVEALPVTAEAARQWATPRVRLAEEGLSAKINDLWIAAAAAANGMDIVTQDGDFDAIERVGGPAVIRV